MTIKKETELNRLTGRFETMTPMQETIYHIALCVFDLDDPKASRQRKRRAGEALVRWRARLQELAAHD